MPDSHETLLQEPLSPLGDSASQRLTIKQIVAPAVQSVLAMWKPLALVQVIALGLAAAYYLVPGVPALTQSASDFKGKSGLWFNIVLIWVASIIVPGLAKAATGVRQTMSGKDLAFLMLYFGVIGVCLEYWYRLVNGWFGENLTFSGLLLKVLLDQTVFSAGISMPIATLAFLWQEKGFSWKQTAASFKTGEFFRRYVSTLAMCWMFWPIIVIAIFALPPNLQYFMSMLCQAAWSLLIVHLSTKALQQVPKPVAAAERA